MRALTHRLVSSTSSISSIAYNSGFEDLPNFIRSFHREFGQLPSRWRTEYCFGGVLTLLS